MIYCIHWYPKGLLEVRENFAGMSTVTGNSVLQFQSRVWLENIHRGHDKEHKGWW